MSKFTIFTGVKIGIEAETPEEAYTKLCNGLHAIPGILDWETDTYSTNDGTEEQSTSVLMPE